jgi:large subunit ribosomal protein L17
LPKAKELKPLIDKVITIGKKNNLSNKKRLFSKLQDKNSVVKVFDVLSTRYQKREWWVLKSFKSWLQIWG